MLIAETQEFVKKANRFNYLNLLSISVLPPPYLKPAAILLQ